MSPKQYTLATLAAQGGAVLTGFFSEFVFKLLRERYRDELAFPVVLAALVFWIHFQNVATLMLSFLVEEKDDPRWLSVLRKLLDLIQLTLIFIIPQYVIVLIEDEIWSTGLSHAEAIMFLLMILWLIYSFVADSPDKYDEEIGTYMDVESVIF